MPHRLLPLGLRNPRWAALLAVAAGIVWAASPARADHHLEPGQHEHGSDHEHGDEGHGHHTIHGAEPEYYDFLGDEKSAFLHISPRLLGFTIVLFLLTFAALHVVAWKPILASLNERQRQIDESRQAAEEAQAEAAKLLDEQNERLVETHAAVREMLDQARRDAAREADEVLKAARERATRQREEAEAAIARAADEARSSLDRAVPGLAGQMARRVLGREVAPPADWQAEGPSS